MDAVSRSSACAIWLSTFPVTASVVGQPKVRAYKTKTRVASANQLLDILDQQINRQSPMLEFEIPGERPLSLPVSQAEAYDAILDHPEFPVPG